MQITFLKTTVCCNELWCTPTAGKWPTEFGIPPLFLLSKEKSKESSPVTVAACICSITSLRFSGLFKPFPVLELGLDDMGRFFFLSV